MKDKIRKNEFKIVVLLGLVTALVTSYLANIIFFITEPYIGSLLMAKIFFTSYNIVVLSALTHNYFKIYREVPTSMSRGLTIFSGALLFYALTSSPILHVFLGFESLTIGVFTYVPDMFAAIAATIILYESYK